MENTIEKAIEQEPCENCISRENALRVAKNEYLRGWHNALRKALSEKYSIHCEEGNFSVIQEETITGLGLSMDCALGKDVESYMSTIPSVTPQEPFINKPCVSSGVCEHDKNVVLDKIRAEIQALSPKPTAFDVVDGNPIKDAVWETIADVLKIIDKYKAESEDKGI